MRLRRFLKLLAAIIALPYGLTILYLFVPPVSTLMLWDWVTFQKVQRQWVPLESISPHLVRAVIAAEDDAFCDHFGIDFAQLEKSIDHAGRRDRPVRATSTITQQTAKNLFLWHGRSWTRKILEAPLTLWIELALPKRRVLEIYLNIAQWGDGVYGVQAAAKHHFGISAATLNKQQSVFLATALPRPLKRNPASPKAGHQMLAAHLMGRLHRATPDTSCLK